MNHNIARKVHHRDTAVWFIQGDVFRQWKSTGRLLWIHGLRMRIYLPLFPLLIGPCVVAGSGKTVLSCVPSQRFHLGVLTLSASSSIIEELHNSNMRKMGLATICFFYFDFRDGGKRDVRHLLSSILIQLCEQSNKFSEFSLPSLRITVVAPANPARVRLCNA